MNRTKRTIAAVSLASVAVLGFPALASANYNTSSATCDGVHVVATAYPSDQANTYTVTLGGTVVASGTFGSSLDKTVGGVPQDGATTTWAVHTQSPDGSNVRDAGGSVGPCGEAPPVLPPKPADIVTTTDATVDSCDLGGSQATHTTTTIGHVPNEAGDGYVETAPVVTTVVDDVVPYADTHKCDAPEPTPTPEPTPEPTPTSPPVVEPPASNPPKVTPPTKAPAKSAPAKPAPKVVIVKAAPVQQAPARASVPTVIHSGL